MGKSSKKQHLNQNLSDKRKRAKQRSRDSHQVETTTMTTIQVSAFVVGAQRKNLEKTGKR